MATFWQQLKALVWRNVLLKKRNKGQLFQELFFPIYFVGILAIIRATTKPEIKPPMTFPVNDFNDSHFGNPFSGNKTIYVTPDTTQIRQWMPDIIAQLPSPLQYKVFSSEAEAEEDYLHISSNVFAGIAFNQSGNMNSYAIRMGYSDIPSPSSIFSFQGGACRDNQNGTSLGWECVVNKYMSTGFVRLQLAIENVLMMSLNVSQDPRSRNIQIQMMDKGEFSPDTSYIQTISSIYFVFSFSFLANYLAVNIVAEKEKKIRDGMLMMGLRSSVFWLSWTLIYMVMIIVAAALMIVIIVWSEFFKQSNMFLLFLCFLLYGSSFVALAFMLTPFFKKARVAGAITGFSTVIVSCIHLGISQTRDQMSYDSSVPAGVQWFLSLLSPIAFASFIDQAIYLDIQMNGFGFDDSLTYGKFPLYAPILMLALDTLLYAILTVYFDHVIPGEYGVRYPPYYFLQSSYWCPGRGRGERIRLIGVKRSQSQTVDIEPVPTDMENKVAMRISSLTKTFKASKKVYTAVDGFCLDIYESQITCLLGHNGAGKTTLINMLTGVVPPTSGTATIRGLDITVSGDMEEIRRVCGICPQHNILYDTLSCYEHLRMFANIKGVPPHLIPKAIETALKDVDLDSQTHTFAKDLSGGQKRKLSVAIALIGDPKLIFLDEPTAGMDPYSRRHLWSLLKKKKEGRVVLLTTHFMDEADILADRKAFIRKGKLRCCGSSLFLKNKFGIGYHLTMVVNPDCRVEKVTNLLKSIIPNTEHQRTHGKEVSYTVPLSDVSLFPALFNTLDQQSKDFGIRSYGVSMTTLEEVFLKLEEDKVVDEVEAETGEINHSFSSNHEDVDVDMQTPLPDIGDLGASTVQGNRLWKQRFWALLKIRFLLMIRSGKAMFFQIILPVALVAAGLAVAKTNEPSAAGRPQSVSLMPQMYANSSLTSYLPSLLVLDSLNSPGSASVISTFQSVVEVDIHPAGTNTSSVAPHYLGMQINSVTGQALTDFVVVYNDSAVHSIPVAINLATRSILKTSGAAASVSVHSYPWPQTKKTITYNAGAMTSALLVGLAFIMAIPGYAAIAVQDREWHLRGQLRISGVGFNIYWGTMYLSDVLIYLIPSVAVLIIVLAMQIPGLSSGGAMGALILLFLTNVPFNIVMALVLSFVFSKMEVCLAYLPHILNILAMLPYLAVSLVDMITQSPVARILHYVCCIIDPPYIVFGGFYFISRLNLLAVMTGKDVSSSDYFKFDNHIIITIIMPLIHFVWMYWLLRVLDVVKTGGTVREAFPCFASSIDKSPALNPDVIDDEDEDVATERARIDDLSLKGGREGSFHHTQSLGQVSHQEPVAYTSQLRKEFVKRTKSDWRCRPGKRKKKIAVRNLSVGVDEGEVLGLLGPNGAGKSTALNMIIAETRPTCGKVVVSGHNIRSNMLSVLESLGYCPQHDALWEPITLEEHIRFFAAVKGIDPRHIDDVVDHFVTSLKLEEHRKKRAKKLSGGTKRKLSYILSMLGSPHLVLMDEPSTGMDPQSKRFLWDTISSSFSNTDRGAILTTHYMEEADALCSRVGIMVNGKLECLGSTQHLKDKYGSGYILEVKLGGHRVSEVETLMDKLENHLHTLFPGLEKVERFMERAQYAIPKEDVKLLGKTFASLESCKSTHGLEEYNFSQSTLEQVFLYFAKEQMEEGQEETIEDKTPSVVRSISRRSASGAVAV